MRAIRRRLKALPMQMQARTRRLLQQSRLVGQEQRQWLQQPSRSLRYRQKLWQLTTRVRLQQWPQVVQLPRHSPQPRQALRYRLSSRQQASPPPLQLQQPRQPRLNPHMLSPQKRRLRLRRARSPALSARFSTAWRTTSASCAAASCLRKAQARQVVHC